MDLHDAVLQMGAGQRVQRAERLVHQQHLGLHGERTAKTILFVTHDLDEAVLLADRVVVMQHGSVHEIMDVPLPRPRGDVEAVRGSAAFAETRYKLWRAINAQAH